MENGFFSNNNTDEMLKSQAEVLNLVHHFADSMALKCAVELHIADIIHSHGRPITLCQLISSIDSSSSPDITCLARIMRLLVRRKIFTADPGTDGGDALYGLTHFSRWILRDAELSLAPLVVLQNDERALAPWHRLSDCVRDGGSAFKKAHGLDIWDYGSLNPSFGKVFNDGMGCMAKMMLRAILDGYKGGFDGVGSLVDVGGGTGGAIAEIVKAYPHIKGINFDQPHVVATAPECDGVVHVGGDMFTSIPNADAIFMKWILHDWDDENCIKILKNCRNAIPEKSGKVIIADAVLNLEGDGLLDDLGLVFDIVMIAHTSGGKERTELEWKTMLNEAGFMRHNIIKVETICCVIEAYSE